MCQRAKFRSLKRSIDTSGIGKRGPMTHINVVSGRRNDKGKEERKEKQMAYAGLEQRSLPVLS